MIQLKTYTRISLINLCFLLLGVLIGTILWKPAQAQGQPAATSPVVKYEEIVPEHTAKTSAFGTVLATRLVSDQIIVRQIDLVALYEGILNLMAQKQFASTDELQKMITSARVPIVPRVRPPDPRDSKQ